MMSAAIYRARRQRLSALVGDRTVLLRGHRPLGRNYPAVHYPFRQDSNLLYFTGLEVPGSAAVIEAGGATTLYLPTPGPDDALWEGELEPQERYAAAAGAEATLPVEGLAIDDGWLSPPITDPSAPQRPWSEELVRAIIELRLSLDEHEVAAVRRAVSITTLAHKAAMEAVRPGVTDTQLLALVDGIFALHGGYPSFPSIVTARGEVLHGHSRNAPMEAGQLLLVDAGAEEPGGYASDVTRTSPVSGRYTPRQRDIYELVLAAADASIATCGPGVRYRDVHLASCRVLTRGLVDLGLLRGDVDGLVEAGAHAAFFPHGVGHLLGLDVHDMELFGDLAGYEPGRQRSDQFGLGFLRLDRDLRPGTIVTVEPGLYFVPAILRDPALRERLGDRVAWDAALSWLPFGGIRIEDDILITQEGHEVLTAAIPRRPDDVEAIVGTGPTPVERLLRG
jgi:Xaa-Pro aminopeptidase